MSAEMGGPQDRARHGAHWRPCPGGSSPSGQMPAHRKWNCHTDERKHTLRSHHGTVFTPSPPVPASGLCRHHSPLHRSGSTAPGRRDAWLEFPQTRGARPQPVFPSSRPPFSQHSWEMGSGGRRNAGAGSVGFAHFHGVNAPTRAGYKLPTVQQLVCTLVTTGPGSGCVPAPAPPGKSPLGNKNRH